MGLFERVSGMVKENIRRLVSGFKDPEEETAAVLHDLERDIIEVQRETVRSIVRKKQLEKQIRRRMELSEEWNKEAALALERGEEALAGQILSRKSANDGEREMLEQELRSVSQTVDQLKSDLYTVKEQLQAAGRKREELMRRKDRAASRLRARAIAGRSADDPFRFRASTRLVPHPAFESYEDAVIRMEAEAEAERIVSEPYVRAYPEKAPEGEPVDREPERLKKKQHTP